MCDASQHAWLQPSQLAATCLRCNICILLDPYALWPIPYTLCCVLVSLLPVPPANLTTPLTEVLHCPTMRDILGPPRPTPLDSTLSGIWEGRCACCWHPHAFMRQRQWSQQQWQAACTRYIA